MFNKARDHRDGFHWRRWKSNPIDRIQVCKATVEDLVRDNNRVRVRFTT